MSGKVINLLSLSLVGSKCGSWYVVVGINFAAITISVAWLLIVVYCQHVQWVGSCARRVMRLMLERLGMRSCWMSVVQIRAIVVKMTAVCHIVWLAGRAVVALVVIAIGMLVWLLFIKALTTITVIRAWLLIIRRIGDSVGPVVVIRMIMLTVQSCVVILYVWLWFTHRSRGGRG